LRWPAPPSSPTSRSRPTPNSRAEAAATKPFPSKEEIAKTLQDAGPSGADPRPYLEQLTIPALWLYVTADREVPVDQSVALLNTLKGHGKDFTIITFPDAGHGLLDSPPTDPQAPTTFVDWVLKQVHAEDA